jgi:eukaryotic-like serine/threonine-protein kinase
MDGVRMHPHMAVHRRLARWACERNVLELERMADVMIELGARSALGEPVLLQLWVDERWLSSEQLDLFLRAEQDEPSTLAFEASTADYDEDSDGPSTHVEPPDLLAALNLGGDPDQTFDRPLSELPAEVMRDRAEQVGTFERMETKVRTNPVSPWLQEDLGINPRAQLSLTEPLEYIAARVAPRPQTPMYGVAPLTRTPIMHQRYALGQVLGAGGGGRVVRAYDRVLGRSVAMKILRPDAADEPAALARFIAEAQTTGQLEHPNIMPVYDFGTLPSGEVFYTMREVRKNSLREVVSRLAAADPAYMAEFPLNRLITLLTQVCNAIHYAHVRGVIHRDLKPDNVMVGEYGEVLVMDWGLARVVHGEVDTSLRTVVERGHTLGTPSYMPPEQARGDMERVDVRSDVYSLGAILYELLTLIPPFGQGSPIDIMWRVVEDQLPSPSECAPQRTIPEDLERICVRAMAYDPLQRYPSARALGDALQAWLGGVQPREARLHVQSGQRHMARYLSALRSLSTLSSQLDEQERAVADWEPPEKKRAMWALEDRRRDLELESARAIGQAITAFAQALAYEPGHAAARRGMADLHWHRLQQAETRGDESNAIYFRAMIKQFDDDQVYAQRMLDAAALRVEVVATSTAVLTLCPLIEQERRLIAAPAVQRGASPLIVSELPIGRYALAIEVAGYPPLRLPIALRRGEPQSVRVELPPPARWRPRFLFIPAGATTLGGDPMAFDPRPATLTELPAVFIAELPVTFGEYLEWIDALQASDPEEALRRAPQLRGSEGLLARIDPKTGRWAPDEILIEGPARERFPAGRGHEFRLPVVGVTAEDAEAYATWRAARDGVPYRLPTEDELEKAGRGVDGRCFPWGDRFDATFCKMRFSRPFAAQPEPAGSFPIDASPYGVRDLAGGVQEWCAGEGDQRPIKGGSWNQDERASRLAGRIRVMAAVRTASIGFRLAYTP